MAKKGKQKSQPKAIRREQVEEKATLKLSKFTSHSNIYRKETGSIFSPPFPLFTPLTSFLFSPVLTRLLVGSLKDQSESSLYKRPPGEKRKRHRVTRGTNQPTRRSQRLLGKKLKEEELKNQSAGLKGKKADADG